jgi:uncharacterized protein YabE (DUF348 family)
MKSTRPRALALLLILLLPQTLTPPPAPPPPRIIVHADGVSHPLETRADTPQELLALAGVALQPGDQILLDGQVISPAASLPPRDPLILQIRRAVSVELNGETLRTTSPTLAAALWQAGIPLRARDQLTPAAATPLDAPLTAALTPARRITVTAAGARVTSRSAAPTVGAALAEAGMPPQGADYSLPPLEAALPADGQIELVRVHEEIVLEQESLPFGTVYQPAPEIEIDTQQVIQAGQFGLRVRRVRVRYENGVEVGRAVEAEWTAAEPKDRIVGYGTSIIVRTLSVPGGSIEYWRAVPAFATSYSPCRLGTNFCGNTTASGLPLQKGVVGVIRSWYNAMVFSQVYVEGYGVGTIADIGAGVPGQHWIDLGYSDDDWEQWASQVIIYFLTPVPPADQILWILP